MWLKVPVLLTLMNDAVHVLCRDRDRRHLFDSGATSFTGSSLVKKTDAGRTSQGLEVPSRCYLMRVKLKLPTGSVLNHSEPDSEYIGRRVGSGGW